MEQSINLSFFFHEFKYDVIEGKKEEKRGGNFVLS